VKPRHVAAYAARSLEGHPRIQSGKRVDSRVGAGSGVELERRAQWAVQADFRLGPGDGVHPPAFARLGPVALAFEAAEIGGDCDRGLLSVHVVVFGRIRVPTS
jgi:hypothetical protein